MIGANDQVMIVDCKRVSAIEQEPATDAVERRPE